MMIHGLLLLICVNSGSVINNDKYSKAPIPTKDQYKVIGLEKYGASPRGKNITKSL